MKIQCRTAALAAASVVACALPATAQNLLTNGDFEDVFAVPSGSQPTDWAVDPFANSASTPARSGTWSLVLRPGSVAGSIASQGDPSFPGATIAVDPGDPVRFSVYAQTLSNDTINRTGHRAIAELFFYDEKGTLTGLEVATIFDGSLDPSLNPEDEWVLAELDSIAPAGSVGMGVALVLEVDSQNTGEGSAYFDDASLIIIPAPGTATLFAVGALAARRRRR
jgi:hypothetical protein